MTSAPVPKEALDYFLHPRIVRVKAPVSITRAKLDYDEAGKIGEMMVGSWPALLVRQIGCGDLGS